MTPMRVTKPMPAAIITISTGSIREKWGACAAMGRLPFSGKRQRAGFVPALRRDLAWNAGSLPGFASYSPGEHRHAANRSAARATAAPAWAAGGARARPIGTAAPSSRRGALPGASRETGIRSATRPARAGTARRSRRSTTHHVSPRAASGTLLRQRGAPAGPRGPGRARITRERCGCSRPCVSIGPGFRR